MGWDNGFSLWARGGHATPLTTALGIVKLSGSLTAKRSTRVCMCPSMAVLSAGVRIAPFSLLPSTRKNAPSALRAPLRAEAHAQETHRSDLRLQGYKRLDFRGESFYLTENDHTLKTSQHRCTRTTYFAKRVLRGGAEGLAGNLILSLFFSCCTLLLC